MEICNDYGDRVGCLKEADPSLTMEGPTPIYWCAFCGPIAHELWAKIEARLDLDPNFEEEFRMAIEKAERELYRQ